MTPKTIIGIVAVVAIIVGIIILQIKNKLLTLQRLRKRVKSN